MITTSYHLSQPLPKVRRIQLVLVCRVQWHFFFFVFWLIKLHVKLAFLLIILFITKLRNKRVPLLDLRGLLDLVFFTSGVTFWFCHRYTLVLPLSRCSPLPNLLINILIVHVRPIKVLIFRKLLLLVLFEPFCKIHGIHLELSFVQLIVWDFGDSFKVLLGVSVNPYHQVDDFIGISILLPWFLKFVKRLKVYRVFYDLTFSSTLILSPWRRM